VGPLQPTAGHRAMQPRVVAAHGHEAVVLWRQRRLRPDGEQFDGEVVGIYQLRKGSFCGLGCSTSHRRRQSLFEAVSRVTAAVFEQFGIELPIGAAGLGGDALPGGG
jgi:hypothetical protein